jgi:ribosomal protein L37AE/L43A
MVMPAPQAPFCPRCGAPAVWHAQLGQWGCDHCRQMLPAAPQPPMQQMPPPQMAQRPAPAAPPPCPNCRQFAVWHPQLGQWGCNHCRMMLPAVNQIYPGQMPNQGSSAGAIVAKVFLVILMIIIIVVIKVGIRGGFR